MGAEGGDSVLPLRFFYPRSGAVFPPDFTPPTFLWTDPAAEFWVLSLKAERGKPFYTVTASPPLPPPAIDSQAIPTDAPMDIPDPNRHRNWTPPDKLWEALKELSGGKPLVLKITGYRRAQPRKPYSRGAIRFSISRDSVGAPIFYRDVPILPTRNETGRVRPLSRRAERLVRWTLRDVARPEGKTMIPSLPTCANCHSFSRDGKTMGFDLDGPQSDKGTYALGRLRRDTDIGRRDVFSWNRDFKGRDKGRKTIGFLSQVSPDGRFVATTVNEEVYIHNYLNHRYIQVFYPTRGVLAYYSTRDKAIRTLPGADDTAFVHCDPAWSPDGKHLVFARARAKDPYRPGQKDPEYPNDPNETQIRYDLYRIPFNHGRGGRAVPIAGAAGNGMSNTFPKVTPDGRFIVFVRCRNGQLLRPDGELWIVPLAGGEARRMECNLSEMNSWHSFSPNGRWMVFASKGFTHYTRLFLTHLDEQGRDSPPVLIPNTTAANRAANLPEFVNRPADSLESIRVSAVEHMQYLEDAKDLLEEAKPEAAMAKLRQALEAEKEDRKFRSEIQVLLGWLQPADSGIAWTRAAIRTDPKNPLAHFNLGVLLEKAGRFEEAARSYRKSRALDPGNAWAAAKLARLHMQTESPGFLDLEKALSLAREADSLAKHREPSLVKILARAYSEAGRFAEAEETARRGLDLARQQGLRDEIQDLQTEIEVYRSGKSFSWALKKSRGEAP